MKNEIIKIFNRKEFYLVVLVMFMAVFADYIYECYMFREVNLSGVISAYDGTILSNTVGTPFGIVFGTLLPFCASMIASTSGLEERKMGLSGCIFTRIHKKKYLFSQGAAIFFVVFGVVFLSLMVSLFLAVITFPIQGYNTMFQTDYDRLLNVDLEFMLDYFYRLHPYINISFFIVLRALFAGVFAWFAYGVSFLERGNKITTILSPFIFVIFMQLIMQFAKKMSPNDDLRIWFNTNILGINHYGKLGMVAAIWSVIFLIGLCGVMKGCRSEAIS